MPCDPNALPAHRPAWHALLGPLPTKAIPVRQPVAPPEVLAGPNGAAVAGWEQFVLALSDPPAGLRTVMALLDADGALLSASDTVLHRTGIQGGPPPTDCDGPACITKESIGGRFEPDGTFRGTRWRSVKVDLGEDEDQPWDSTPSDPSPAEITALKSLAQEIVRRCPR